MKGQSRIALAVAFCAVALLALPAAAGERNVQRQRQVTVSRHSNQGLFSNLRDRIQDNRQRRQDSRQDFRLEINADHSHHGAQSFHANHRDRGELVLQLNVDDRHAQHYADECETERLFFRDYGEGVTVERHVERLVEKKRQNLSAHEDCHDSAQSFRLELNDGGECQAFFRSGH